MEKYEFEITDLRSSMTQYSYDSNLVVKILSEGGSRPLYLHIKLKLAKDVIVFDNMHLEVCPTWDKDEQLGFIAGTFEFRAEDIKNYIGRAIKELQQDNRSYYLPSKWRCFADQFRSWYESKVKPFIENEINIFNNYVKSTDN